MNNDKYNYYESELGKIDTNSKYRPQIKVMNSADGKSTNWLSLNDEAANELVKWLKSNFNITE